MHGLLLLLHLLGATIWTGGHLILCLTVLPKVLKERSVQRLLDFESAFEKVGMPAIALQVITGLMLAYRLVPDVGQWFNMANPLAHGIAAKLLLLTLTVAFALHARFRVIPHLSEKSLTLMAWHIIPVTILSILFVVVGASFRTGWLY
ncbi:CopD family protein [Oceanisphaera avium]|uniref:Copper resistance protein CopD n=1 Tax=Oceanisphaera avium TaxID=1903694 RepID=A0A1Y0CYI5_9GAMM|nr:CopD family protein [Oceanisphaera avium]ART80380.1 copper resistance protein CopD [Oceanisphaera avium]